MGIHDGHRANVRRRFLQAGLDAFADHEALELLLFYAIPRRDTNEIAHTLIDRYGSLEAVLNAPQEDLEKVDGIGENAAVLLRLVPQLWQKARLTSVKQERILNNIDSAGAYLVERFSDAPRSEVVFQLCLDRKGKLLACKRMGEGGPASVVMDVRKLLENAILTSASSVILGHNHPSGVALPSDDDYYATLRAKEVLATIGVELLDHIIVADQDFVSMRQSGYVM